MITEVDPDEFLRDASGEPVAERHRTDDPSVWGLLDVARGQRPAHPVTVYKTKGDSASGVVGRLTADGTFHPIHSTRIGREFTAGLLHDVRPSVGEATITYVTAWDGAAPSEEFLSEEHGGVQELRSEHTRGALLGDYGIRRDIDRGAKQTRNKAKYGRKPSLKVPTLLAGSVAPQGVYVEPNHGMTAHG